MLCNILFLLVDNILWIQKEIWGEVTRDYTSIKMQLNTGNVTLFCLMSLEFNHLSCNGL